MPFLHRDKRSATGRRDFAVRFEGRFDDCTIFGGFDDVRAQVERNIHRRRASQRHMKVRSNGARRYVGA